MLALVAGWAIPSENGSAAAGGAASAVSPGPPEGAAGPDHGALTVMFDAMSRAVARDRRADFIEAAGSTLWARQTWRTLTALGVKEIDLRYVPSGAPRPRNVDVAVTWRPGTTSAYQGTTTVPRQVTFTVAATDAGAAVIGAGRARNPLLPVWLSGVVVAAPLGDATVISTARAGPVPGLTVLTRRALVAVRAELAESDLDTDRRVVVVAPASAEEAVLLGGRELRGAAALTTTVDGSPRAQAPVHVVLNPAVFDGLTPRGAQVVLTHEVTHAVTGAAASAMPLWIAEGFADWVALRDAGVPLDVAAEALVRSVRQDGLPGELPRDVDFTRPATPAYEAAWTVFRLLSQRAGDRAVLGFYADVRDGQPVATALEVNAGLDVTELTKAWRTDLRRLARG